jgi:hypothetical protein
MSWIANRKLKKEMTTNMTYENDQVTKAMKVSVA